MKDKNKLKIWGLCFLGGILLSSCTVKKVAVQKTPTATAVYTHQDQLLQSGYPKKKTAWVVYAGKHNASLYAKATSELAVKNVAFLTPLIVLKQKGNRFKVAQYEAGSRVENKIEKTKIKELGWMHQSDLLLWTESLRDAKTGFRLKGVLAIQEKSVLSSLEKYMEKDSMFVFKDPSLLHRGDRKIPLNSIVYLYALTEDYKKVFIGESTNLEEGNPQNEVLGWVDARLLGIWGARTAIRMKSSAQGQITPIGMQTMKDSTTSFTPILQFDARLDTLDLGHLYPISYRSTTDDFKINYLDQVLDYSENKVYNVEGNPLYYESYKRILADNRHLNVIFVLDGSKEVAQHMAPLQVVFQGLGMQFASHDYFKAISFASLFYHVDRQEKKNDKVQLLDFENWSRNLRLPFHYNLTPSMTTTLSEAMVDLMRLLETKKYQSNLVVIVGQRLSPEDQVRQKKLAEQIASTGSCIIFYQVAANSRDAHNDFVLTAEEVIKRSADQISKDKKQRIVAYEQIVESNVFDLSQGDQGVYQLDFPTQSMHQGAVIFPRKGEENKPILLKNTLTKIVRDKAWDNQRVDSTLTVVFNSDLGVSHTKIKPIYLPMYQQERIDVPSSIAKQLVNQNHAFMQEGILKKQTSKEEGNRGYGVLLNEEEMEQLEAYYRRIHANVFKKGSLNNKKMIRRYITAARKNNVVPVKMNRKFWKSNTMTIGLFQQTGLYLTTLDTLAKLELKQWKRRDLVNQTMLEHFFKSFQTIADKIKENKENQEGVLQKNGTKLYWLNQDYIPVLDYDTIKKEEETFEFLLFELEEIQATSIKKKKYKSDTKKYITRVKKGMP